MIDREHDLPIVKQAKFLRISRRSVYYLPRPVPDADLAIMRRLDRLHLEYPFAGSRMLRGLLAAEGCKIGRRHVKTLMKRMGIEALPPSPHHQARARSQDLPVSAARSDGRAAEPGVGDGHHLHPDGARLRLSGRSARLVQRRVLSWRLSITVDAAFCVETLEDALARHGRPDIFNTDQGSQSPRRPSPACSPATALRSAWTARAPGATTCSSSGCGAASNTRRSICEPTTVCPRPAPRSAVTWTSTMAGDRIRALTA